MEIKFFEYTLKTNKRRELVNITNLVENAVNKSKIKEGIVLIFLPHATCGLFANEDEINIKKDYFNFFERLCPENDIYHHNQIDNNADSHLLSSIFKQFYVFPIKDYFIIKGTWQDLFLAEFDGPRERKIHILIFGSP
ncbi:MAG: secondary thiamine-phosphate synthase enzyme YjbQ [Nanopusillaceae archaeon]